MNRPLRILVADDERDTREYLQELLTRLGYQVAAAQTGSQMVELARAAAPDLIVADIKMPDMDGIAAAEIINRERETPVILVSGHHDAALVQRATQQPVMAYLVKPIKQSDVETAVAVAMARFEQYHLAREEAKNLKQALEERKFVERAKGAVMRRLSVGEEEAFRLLRKLSSTQNQKVIDIAQLVLQAEEVFKQLESV
jgi:response regulator NasT